MSHDACGLLYVMLREAAKSSKRCGWSLTHLISTIREIFPLSSMDEQLLRSAYEDAPLQ